MEKTNKNVIRSCRGLCEGWTSPGVFQKVCGNCEKGVAIYQYYVFVEQGPEACNPDTDRVLVLQNTSDIDIARRLIINEIENNQCKCRRCHDVLRNTCELLKDLKVIKKKEIRGICNHCKMHSDEYCNKCARCNIAIRDFLASKVSLRDRERAERMQSWLCKVRELLKSIMGRQSVMPERLAQVRIHSDTQLNKLLKVLKSPCDSRQPHIDELLSGDLRRIHSETELTELGDNEMPSTSKQVNKGEIMEKIEDEEIEELGIDDLNIPERIKIKKLEAQAAKVAFDEKKMARALSESQKEQESMHQGELSTRTDVEKSGSIYDEKARKIASLKDTKSKTDTSIKEGKRKGKEKTDHEPKEPDDQEVLPKTVLSKNDRSSKGIKKISPESMTNKLVKVNKEKRDEIVESTKREKKIEAKESSTSDKKAPVPKLVPKDKSSDAKNKDDTKVKSELKAKVDTKEKDGLKAPKEDTKAKGDFKAKDESKDATAATKAKEAEETGKVNQKGMAAKNKDDKKGKDDKITKEQASEDKPEKRKGSKEAAETGKGKISKEKEQDKSEPKRKDDDMIFRMAKEAKERDRLLEAAALKKASEEKAAKAKLEKAILQEVPKKVEPTVLKVTTSQMKQFREQAEQQRNLMINTGGTTSTRSRMTKFNEEIFRSLNLHELPEVGEMYKSVGDFTDLSSAMNLHLTALENRKKEEERKSIVPKKGFPRDVLKTPPRGVMERQMPGVGYKLIGEHKEEKNAVKKQEKDMRNVVFGGELSSEYQFERTEEQVYEIGKMIVGGKICKFNPNLIKKKHEDSEIRPIMYQLVDKDDQMLSSRTAQTDEAATGDKAPAVSQTTDPKQSDGRKDTKAKSGTPSSSPKGVIRYALSDRQFIDKGWTMLPTEKIVRKMNIYRMQPAHPEFDWFARNKSKGMMLYDTGEKLAEFDEDGRGRWFYRCGRTALHYYSAEEMNAAQRYVVYSSGEPDERGLLRPATVLASFDWLGNGIVFDHTGKIRLKYNQTEGVVLDRSLGPVTHWKWHTLNDPPVLQQVMIDTHLSHKEPEILKYDDGELNMSLNRVSSDNEEMLTIEFNNFVKEKSKKLTQKFKPYQIKMKALKINRHFSLRVLDQATVHLLFRDGQNSLKLNLGMILDPKEIVDTETAEVGEVASSYDRLPARTDSLGQIQQTVAMAGKLERLQSERLRRVRRPEPQLSIDKLTDMITRPAHLLNPAPEQDKHSTRNTAIITL